jgi:hypothetical protein
MDINVLFQDVDLVWFKDPFPYFHDFNKNNPKSTEIDGFFSDDGQVSICIYICIYVCICTYICMYRHASICINVHTF